MIQKIKLLIIELIINICEINLVLYIFYLLLKDRKNKSTNSSTDTKNIKSLTNKKLFALFNFD